VSLVEVDIVGLKALQGAVDGFHDVLAAQTGVIWTLGGNRPVNLGKDFYS
jgi:hypothetical protein